MINIFQEILKIILFTQPKPEDLILIPSFAANFQLDKQFNGNFFIPNDLFPENCNIQAIPDGEAFIEGLKNTLSQVSPSRVFIWPPFETFRRLSDDIRTKFPNLNLEEIVLKVAIETLPGGSLLGITLPSNSFSSQNSRQLREYIFQKISPRFVITYDFSWQSLGFNVHNAFKMNTLIVEIGQKEQLPLKFFKCPKTIDESQKIEVIADLQRLHRQTGGKTKNGYGYVLREGIMLDAPLLHDKYHPDLRKHQEDVATFAGSIRPLKELCDFYTGLHLVKDAIQLLEVNSNEGVFVVEARNILENGSISLVDIRHKVKPPLKLTLQSGDICLRKIINFAVSVKPFLYVAEITEEILPLTISETVYILRVKPFVTYEERGVLIAFLRSSLAFNWLKAQDLGGFLHINILQELPIPIPDKNLSSAIKSLNEAANQFEQWKSESEKARSQIFAFASTKDARLHILATGRQARQRQEAAELVSDTKHRIRTQFPHPIAYRWRTIECSHSDIEGYIQILECAETVLCYLAQVCMLLARSVGGEIGYVQGIAERLSKNERGTNMGDWFSIISEVCESKKFRHLSGQVAFYEVLTLSDSMDNFKNLMKRRNDQAHGRGPKGIAVQQAYQESLNQLENLLKNVEFVSEYSLIYIESTQRDVFKKTTEFSYRKLMGDHPLVPIQQDETAEVEVESKSLYLRDRDKKLHLLRPLLSRRECLECGSWATFYLDSYEKKGDYSLLKSMEHGHTAKDKNISSVFREIGLLLPVQ